MPVTTDYDFEVSPGDEVGTDTALVCCGQTMTATGPDRYGTRAHTCGRCRTRADVDKHGLISDITG